MTANKIKVICPVCKAVNKYNITRLEMFDTDLHATYNCTKCGACYTDFYMLSYIGGFCNGLIYDRDNIELSM